ncbi:hypothetical protein GIW05_00160 [Pseudomonas syringae]|uniref:hypothetical protein n=1 Tax=Pseudomonas syringae TaxID=317 RepID=UPI001F2B65F6|nr:hypothetical protein [Pseudomonas syringae]MCF5381934.1 hypothetical protein [Pseudomonas syringae]MCF5423812.1 hypothetical protein [Pseudomonas syringae]MCF5455003.1 hypothetical protein [Pseudomonas syringae]MCF5459559.1 hypothetical protein [Pseudomonas syringae]
MAATWIDNLREWNYDWHPVARWLMDTLDYQVVRHGPIAYGVAALIVIMIFLSFPPTRGLTKAFCGGVFKLIIAYAQIVASLLTVHFVGFLARLSLTLFHKARIWLIETVRRARE